MSSNAETLLALDNAGDHLTLAVHCQRARCIRTIAAGPDASRLALPELVALLGEIGLSLSDVEALAFGSGPGAFTGVRLATSIAQGLAFSLQKPLIAVDTFATVAMAGLCKHGARLPPTGTALVALDARLGELYLGWVRFEAVSGGAAPWRVERWAETLWSSTQVEAEQRLLARTGPAPWVGFGNGFALAPGLQAVLATDPLIDAEVSVTGDGLLDVALDGWRRGLCVDPANAAPLYVRNKVALTEAERGVRR